MAAAGWCRKVIQEDKPAKLFLDVGGVGAGVSDRLQEMGLGSKIEAVNFGSSPIEPAPLDDNGKPFGGPANRRAEMWLNMKKWLEEPAGVTIPDKDEVQADCVALPTSTTATRVCCLRRRRTCGAEAFPRPTSATRSR